MKNELLIPSVITKNHTKIGDDLILKIQDILARGEFKISNYSVSAGSKYSSATESLNLEINDKISLAVVLSTSNS